MNASWQEAALARAVHWFEALTPASLADIDSVYTTDAWFKDPFHEVRGREQIAAIYRQMFAQLDTPSFIVIQQIRQGPDAVLTWDFMFGLRRPARRLSIHGASHLGFGDDGRIRYHRDYWDAAEELYEKLPLLGPLMRGLKRVAQG